MNEMTIVLSIIVPIYNAEKYILSFIENFDFNYSDMVELILVDDGSSDSTPNLLKNLSRRANINVIVSTHNGSAAARNIGFRASRGEYVIFADIDDYLEVSSVINLVESMRQNKIDILRNKYVTTNLPNHKLPYVSESNIKFTPMGSAQILSNMGFWTYIFKRETLLENSIIFWPSLSDIKSDYFVLDDWFFLMSLLNSGLPIVESNVIIYNYFFVENKDKNLKQIRQQKELIKCYIRIARDYRLRSNILSCHSWKYVILDLWRSVYFNLRYFGFKLFFNNLSISYFNISFVSLLK
jgi:glycosyltransferase involved in cell wall biosynthesis